MTATTAPRYTSVVPAVHTSYFPRAEIRFDLSGLSTVLADAPLVKSVTDLAEDTAESGSYSVTVTDTMSAHYDHAADPSGYLAERFFPYATHAGHVADVICCHECSTVLVVVGKV